MSRITGIGGEGAGEREHLLLAAGQRPGQLRAPFGEAGEAGEGTVLEIGDGDAAERRHQEVLAHGEVREDPSTLGDRAHPGAGQRIRGDAGRIVAGDPQRPAGRPHQPAGDLERGRLAGAVRPEHGDDLAGSDGDADAVEDFDRAVAGVHVAQFEERRRDHADPQVRLENGTIALDLGRRAVGDHAAEIEDVDVVAHVHHERHVVFDDQHGEPVAGQRREERTEPLGLLVVEPGCGLVEQQHPWRCREGACDLDHPGGAGRQITGPLLRLVGGTDPTQQLVDAAVHVALVGQLDGDPHVVGDGQRREQLEPLERAGEPVAGAAERRLVGDVEAVDHDPTGGGLLHPGDDVEERGLAGAVRADQTR